MSVQHRSLFDLPLVRPPFVPAVPQGITPGRNWYFDTVATWSRDRDCSLLVSAAQFPEPVSLMLECVVFGASPETPRTLLIESPGHLPVRHEIRSATSQFLHLRSPDFTGLSDPAEIMLRLDRLDSPFGLGQSADDRLLGLTVLSLQPFSADHVFPLNFRASGGGERYLLSGWARPEAQGVWSEDSRAVLLLPPWLRGRARALRFGLHVLPRPEGSEPLTVTIACNGQVMLERICPPERSGSWLCPLGDSWPEGAALEVELNFTGLRSPADLGINVDRRPLGILLQSLTAEEDE